MYNIHRGTSMKKKSNNYSDMLKQIKTIVNDPSYEIAEEDKNFIYSNEARGVRLQLDYLKAEVKKSSSRKIFQAGWNFRRKTASTQKNTVIFSLAGHSYFPLRQMLKKRTT